MNVASVQTIAARFRVYLKTSEKGPVVITQRGKPVALLISLRDESELERLLLAYSPQFQEILGTARRQIREGRGIPHKDFWQEIEAETYD